ncbi:MAG: hypothetical protein P1V36_10675, partial [Planctomycetota bacterium]|nr:hypothetical protein [Planctomycetota bacterium]
MGVVLSLPSAGRCCRRGLPVLGALLALLLGSCTSSSPLTVPARPRAVAATVPMPALGSAVRRAVRAEDRLEAFRL